MSKRLVILGLALVFLLSGPWALADEGMWPPYMIKQLPLDQLHQRGLQLSADDLVNLKDAIVLLGGGTGSFVSPDGLVITNHHVAYGAIQYQSTAKQNFIANGFLARSREEELPAPGYTASILVDYRDVTKRVLKDVKPGMSDLERAKAIEKAENEIVKEAESEGKGLSATVVDMLSGTSYYLFVYRRFKDVRLVYAPPASVGEYGGDIDNWVWPRHTGDFSFMRVYTGPDGEPAEYSKENVPYHPKKWLKIAPQPVRKGDFVMVMGYPGNTMRYRSSYSIDLWQNLTYPESIELLQAEINVLEEAGKKNPELAVRFASRIKGLNNALKYYQGMLEGLKKTHLLEKKRKQEAEFTRFLDEHPDLKAKYGDVLPSIAELYKDLRTYHRKQTMLGQLIGGSQILSFAYTIEKWHEQLKKPESERERGFLDRDLEQTKEAFKNAQRNLHVPTDKQMLIMLLEKAADLPPGQQIAAVQKIVDDKKGEARHKAIVQFVDSLYAGTKLADVDTRVKALEMSDEELQKLDDPMLGFALELKKEMDELEPKYKAFVGAVMRLRPRLIRGMHAWKKGALYPDANRTLRLTYGTVKGYSPRDAVWYRWATTLHGVIEKDTGKEPFNCPEVLKEIDAKKDCGRYAHPDLGDVMVDFIADLDITGGNSGSPVMNGKGELVGVAFDGNYEAMTSDFVFDPDLTRAISVSIGYVQFIADRLNHATNVLKELGVAK